MSGIYSDENVSELEFSVRVGSEVTSPGSEKSHSAAVDVMGWNAPFHKWLLLHRPAPVRGDVEATLLMLLSTIVTLMLIITVSYVRT